MNHSAPTILILDDDANYCDAMQAYLESHGCRVNAIQDPAKLDAALVARDTDLLLLDQRLGGTTGTEVLMRIRTVTNLPCIVVTGQSDATDRIVNLEIGADDEVEKTVPPREMLARIRSVLRRHRGQPLVPAAAAAGPRWQLSLARRELYRPDGTLCRLTTVEFDTLCVLYEANCATVSRAELSVKVFRRPYVPSDRAVDTAVRKLRQKLGPEQGHRIIKSVRSTGYMFAGFLGEDVPHPVSWTRGCTMRRA
jgi:DNA-binding response OmpR family regulator